MLGLIRDFKSKVNSNSYFILNQYKNKDGRNHWNLICSCMDWIELAIDAIFNQPKKSDNINVKCMQAYSYISAIDIVWESIQQLHRAIVNKDSIPFNGDKKIFSNNSICNDDNDFFKHIRAVFGAHPVNLNRGGKWFASWPTDHVYDEYDYAVILYNANADKNEDLVVFGYKIKELEEFLDSRYSYLNVLIEEIETQYQNYRISKVKQAIEHSDNPIKQLMILKHESEVRLDNDYYSNLIDELLILYQAKKTLSINNKPVEEYLKECKKLIFEIRLNLQNMKFSELKNSDFIDLKHPTEIHYHLSKIHGCLIGLRNDFLFDHYLDKISEFLKNHVTITSDMNRDEIFLLIKVGLYNFWICNKRIG